MQATITKAVFPVAGLGTRFLPATKATPKEMLPIVDKPLIQYAVEEAVSAGINQIIFVTSSSKHAIENHFDSNFELEAKLAETGKHEWLEIVRSVLPAGVTCAYIRQTNPLGLGHAVLCAKDVVGNEPFAVLLADDLINSNEDSCLKQMIDVYQEIQNPILAVQPVPLSDTEKYGIVGFEEPELELGRYSKINAIVEKPKTNDAPSRFAIIGRYILPPEIFYFLENTSQGAIGEIQLTDGIAKLLSRRDVYSYRFYGKRYDCGSKLGYLEATVEYGIKHREVGKHFTEYLKNVTID